MKHLLLAGLVGLIALSVLGPAAAHAETDYQAHFGDIDTNGDGKMDMMEYHKYFPQGSHEYFMDADANKDGSLDHDEWHAFKEKHAAGGAPHAAGHGEGEGHDMGHMEGGTTK